MGPLPALLRLVLWALAAAAVSMGLYRMLSPQAALQDIKRRRVAVQEQLRVYDGAMAQAMPLLGQSLNLALSQLLRVLWPTAVAALPVIVLILWLDMVYGYRFPAPGAPPIAAETDPASVGATLRPVPGADDRWMVALDHDGGPGGRSIVLDHPVPAIHKLDLWGIMIGNPAGHLPRDAAVDEVVLHLPAREYISAGPAWLRGWYVPFFAALFAASLAIKLRFGII